jgi:hypothetical protein
MNEWVLIIALFSPAGDFMDKNIVEFKTQKDCEAVRVQLPRLNSPLGVKHQGVCVTKAHWSGKKKMPEVAYD